MRRWVIALTVATMMATIAPRVWARPTDATIQTIAYTHAGNIWLMTTNGTNRRAITTQGGTRAVSYSRYSWSPDGKYLALLRRSFGHGSAVRNELRLYNARGEFVRSLGMVVDATTFYPAWAVDSDQLAAVVQQRPAHPVGAWEYTVAAISVSGARHVIWHFRDYSACDDSNPDPAEAQYVTETGFGGVPVSLQWSVRHHIAFFSPNWCGATDVVDTRIGRPHLLIDPSLGTPIDEVRISPDGRSLVGHTINQALVGSAGAMRDQVLVAPLANLQFPTTIGAGELPAWSADSRSVYFVHRTPGRVLHAAMSDGLEVSFQTYRTTIWQTGVTGYPLHTVATLNAYGTSPLRVLNSSTHALVFSVVDNDWDLWRHRQANGQYNLLQLQQYGPRTRIVRLDSGFGAATIARDAGRPAPRP